MFAQDLPVDLLINIFLRLPMKSLICCRGVCKSWYNLFSDTPFIQSHFRTYGQSSKLLLLKEPSPSSTEALTKDEEEFIRFCMEWFSECTRFKIPRPIKGCISRESPYGLLGPCNGLLCIHGPLNRNNYRSPSSPSAYNICLWNPSTGEIKILPKLKKKQIQYHGTKAQLTPVACGFGHVPNPQNRDMDDYRVVLVLQDAKQLQGNGAATIHIFIYSLNTNSWRNISSHYARNSSISLYWTNSSGIFFQGALHWIARKRIQRGQGREESCKYKLFLLAINLDDDGDRDIVREINVPEWYRASCCYSLYPWVYQGPNLALTAHFTTRQGDRCISTSIMVDYSSSYIYKCGWCTYLWAMEDKDEADYGDNPASPAGRWSGADDKEVHWTRMGTRVTWSRITLSSREKERVKTALCGILLESGDEELVLYDAKELYRLGGGNPSFNCFSGRVIARYCTCTRPYKQTIVSPNHHPGAKSADSFEQLG